MRSLLFAAALALLPGNQDADAAARLTAHPWAGWVDGSWVKTEIRGSTAGTVASTQRLVSLGEDTYRLKTEATSARGRSEDTRDHGYGLMGYAHTAPDGTLVGTEQLVIAGTPLDCQVWKVRWEEDGQPFQSVAWVAEGVEHPVRVGQKGGELELQLEIEDLEDWITIDRRKIRCVRYTGFTSYQGRRSPVTQWRSADIPGGLARTVTRIQTPEGLVEHENRVVEFRGERRR